MATKHIRVRLSFTHESDHQIEETTGAVILRAASTPPPTKTKSAVSWLRFCASSPVTFRATATTISPRCSPADSRPSPPAHEFAVAE